jgi:hypothetical protein
MMPRGNGTGPPWSSGQGSGRNARGCPGPRSSTGSEMGGSRLEKYIAFIEMLVPLASALVMLFKKSKAPRDQISTLTGVSGEADDSKRVEGGGT